jgi:dTDP-glucose 4,6-dehydratase
MKNILVTGGCGFIGTNFIRYLLSAPDFSGRIVNVDKLTYAGNPENLAGVEEAHPDRYRFIQADICDIEAISGVFDAFEIDSICHFAAESHVDRSIAAPDAFIQTNVVGTFNLLELARRFKDRPLLFHHVSTDEVYGDLGADGCFTEKTPYNPSSPYSASKAASDHLVRAYSRTYGIAVTLSNCSNNYGPYQFPEKLIPLMILNARDGKTLPVYGDGRNVRDWLYVEDHCRAIWEIMKRGRRGETYNIGGRCELSNIDVVERICDILDRIGDRIGDGIDPKAGIKRRRELIRFVKDRPGHDRRYAIDCCRLENELGWTPAESFGTGLEKTVRWYLQNPDWVRRVQSGEYRLWMKQHYET